jgi:6-phosphogluconate dehydrogenase
MMRLRILRERVMSSTRFAMVGLGRMGGNMVRRLARVGQVAAVFDRTPAARATLAAESKAIDCASLAELVAATGGDTATHRVIWLMLPAGETTSQTFAALLPLLAPGDVIVDGANTWYRDSMERGAVAAQHGIGFVDAGVSGGVWGLDNGYGLMVGGAPEHVAAVEPYLRALAPAADRGWLRCGPVGAGHYAKMVHNGIEYGLMQAYAEGLALLEAKRELELDPAAIAESWRHGTVIRSWLLDLTAEFLARDTSLESIAPVVADSGEGRWTASEAIELGIPTPVISLALMQRFASQGRADYTNRVLARMRQAFGGHAVMSADDKP